MAECARAAAGGLDGQADDFRRGDEADAGGCDGDSEAGSDETKDGEPVGGLLNDLRTEAVLFAEGEGLFKGVYPGAARIVDERVVTKSGG